MHQRLRHVREQIADAKLQLAELMASLIEPRMGSREARAMFRYVMRRMRKALTAATPSLSGSEAVICEQLRDVVHATLIDIVARRTKWPKKSK